MAIRKIVTIAAVIGMIAVPVSADWDIGDGHKMHYPQLPDPNGWDVNITNTLVFDDWQCGGSGPVSDIHFWGSWRNDVSVAINNIHIEIWSDTPVDDPQNQLPYSHPTTGGKLWQANFAAGEFTIRQPEYGDQGWYDPTMNPETVIPHDHNEYYQINIDNIPNPFVQTLDEVYWLAINVETANPNFQFGWKTSTDHWNDDAVYYQDGWQELRDPLTTESLDMAFVITPEPAALCLLALGGLCIMRRR